MKAIKGNRYAAIAEVPARGYDDHDRSFIAKTASGAIEIWLPNEATYNMPDDIQGYYPENGEGIWITLIGDTEPNHKGETGDLFLVERVL